MAGSWRWSVVTLFIEGLIQLLAQWLAHGRSFIFQTNDTFVVCARHSSQQVFIPCMVEQRAKYLTMDPNRVSEWGCDVSILLPSVYPFVAWRKHSSAFPKSVNWTTLGPCLDPSLGIPVSSSLAGFCPQDRYPDEASFAQRPSLSHSLPKSFSPPFHTHQDCNDCLISHLLARLWVLHP